MSRFNQKPCSGDRRQPSTCLDQPCPGDSPRPCLVEPCPGTVPGRVWLSHVQGQSPDVSARDLSASDELPRELDEAALVLADVVEAHVREARLLERGELLAPHARVVAEGQRPLQV